MKSRKISIILLAVVLFFTLATSVTNARWWFSNGRLYSYDGYGTHIASAHTHNGFLTTYWTCNGVTGKSRYLPPTEYWGLRHVVDSHTRCY